MIKKFGDDAAIEDGTLTHHIKGRLSKLPLRKKCNFS